MYPVGPEETLGWHSAEARVGPLWMGAQEALRGPGNLLAHHTAEGRSFRTGVALTLCWSTRPHRADMNKAHQVRSVVTYADPTCHSDPTSVKGVLP